MKLHVRVAVIGGGVVGVSEFASESSGLEIQILGEWRPARILKDAPYDPQGKRLRM